MIHDPVGFVTKKKVVILPTEQTIRGGCLGWLSIIVRAFV
jgi:hypothetical protein